MNIHRVFNNRSNCALLWNFRRISKDALVKPYLLKSEYYYCPTRKYQHKLNDWYEELNHEFEHFGRANGELLEMFCGGLDNFIESYKVDDIILKIKLAPVVDLSTLTQRSILWYLFSIKNEDTLFKILGNPSSYKIYPDNYFINLLLDTFLTDRSYLKAAKVAVALSDKKVIDNYITVYMGLYSCSKYLQNCQAVINNEESMISDFSNFKSNNQPYFLYEKSIYDGNLEVLIYKTMLNLCRFTNCNNIKYSYLLLVYYLLNDKKQINIIYNFILSNNVSVYEDIFLIAASKFNSSNELLKSYLLKKLKKMQKISYGFEDAVLSKVKIVVEQFEQLDIENQRQCTRCSRSFASKWNLTRHNRNNECGHNKNDNIFMYSNRNKPNQSHES